MIAVVDTGTTPATYVCITATAANDSTIGADVAGVGSVVVVAAVVQARVDRVLAFIGLDSR